MNNIIRRSRSSLGLKLLGIEVDVVGLELLGHGLRCQGKSVSLRLGLLELLLFLVQKHLLVLELLLELFDLSVFVGQLDFQILELAWVC